MLLVHNTLQSYAQSTHTHFKCTLSMTTRVSRCQKGKSSVDFTKTRHKRVAVASAGPYASMHLASPSQQHHSTEGKCCIIRL